MPRTWPTIITFAAAMLLAPSMLGMAQCSAADATKSPIAPGPVAQFPPGQPSVHLPITRGGRYLFVQAKVNDQPPGWFLVDTGTSVTMIDRTLAQSIHLKPFAKQNFQAAGGAAEMEFVHVDHFSLGDVAVDLPLLASTDMRTFKLLTGVDFQGILGNDVLLTTPMTLDFRAPALTLFRPDSHPIEKGSGIPGRIFGEIAPSLLLIHAKVEGVDGWFELDTGDPGSFEIFHPFATLYSKELENKPSFQIPRVGLGGTATEVSTRLDHVELFGRSIEKTWGTSLITTENPANADFAGVIGTEYLDDACITVEPGELPLVNLQWLPKESAQSMLSRLGDPKGHDLSNLTPLMWACRKDRIDVATAMIDAGADVNAADAIGRTPLMIAAQNGYADLTQLLIAHGANVDVHTVFSDTALISAAEYGFPDVVEQLITAKANVNARNTLQQSPIFMASQAGFHDVVKLLIDAGADVNILDNNRHTPLMAAAFGQHPEVEQLLLDHGANVLAYDATRITALAAAAMAGDSKGVALLLQRGAAVDFADSNGDTALSLAAASGRSAKSIRLLLAAGADPNATNNAGLTPLATAEARSWQDAIITLLPVTTLPTPNP